MASRSTHGSPRTRPVAKRIEGSNRNQWIFLLSILTVLPYFLAKLHYSLPSPRPPTSSDGPQPSEELVLVHIRALEDIGYRTVGTPQAKRGEEYVEAQVRLLQQRCEEDGILDCDVWVQTGDGFHEFTIMDHDVLKIYKGITNVILRIQAKDTPRKKDAVLLGSHIDSTLPAPGAADDGVGVGVMLDIARVLVDRQRTFDNSVIFLWNGGEETLQDGSHLYSTRHETAKDVRAVINLEAAGTTGGALLFQATSKEMIRAFAHAPYPRGTVIAADVFASGVLMSDTDFVQFQQYLNVSGLDMAIVGHSYFYHTQKDRLEYLEPGAAQHFADNVMAILDHLLSGKSPLSSAEPWSTPDLVYLSMYDRLFFSWSMGTATRAYSAIAALVVAVTATRIDWRKGRVVLAAVLGVPLGTIGGLITANAVAGIMFLLDRRLSWFKHEHLCLVLFVPAGYIGYLGVQLWLSRKIPHTEALELAHYHAQMVFPALQMIGLQLAGVRSAYLFAVIACIMLLGSLGDFAFRSTVSRRISFVWSYGLSLVGFTVIGVEALTTVLDIFAPLTGRMGKDAPAEFIIATLSSVCAFTLFPPLVPLFHRLSRSAQVNSIRTLVVITISVIVLFSGPWWKTYDSMHPKRAGVQYTYNHTTNLCTANIAFMDSGPELDFVDALHKRYGTHHPVEKTVMNKANPDWDVLYPVSSFLDTYRFPLEQTPFEWPSMGIKVNETIMGDVRKVDLTLNFTGLVWPTLAFNAEILDWSFDFTPPKGHRRHHVKMATTIDSPIVDLSLTIPATGPLSLHYVAIDLKQMVPGTAAEMGPDMPGSKLLLDLHEWAKVKYDDALEILTYAAVADVVEV